MADKPQGYSRDALPRDREQASILREIREESSANYKSAVERLNSIREREIESTLCRSSQS